MIPQDYVTAWRKQVPWVQDFQVEQDLILSRALVEIFSHPVLAGGLAMRGGTAIYKLYLQPPARYSEDIDLVQTAAVPAGSMMDALREVLNPWLGTPKWKQTESRVTFVYRFDAEQMPRLPLRLKIEINTREHFSVFELARVPSWWNHDGLRASPRSSPTNWTSCSAPSCARSTSAGRAGTSLTWRRHWKTKERIPSESSQHSNSTWTTGTIA